MKPIGIIMNGVTGRMGTRQHLERSIMAIRNQGGLTLANGERLMPDPILLGRNEEKLRTLAQQFGIERWSTNIEACLADPYNEIYFDSQTTLRRAADVKKAIEAGKHIYCEKPTAVTSEEALELARLATEKGVKNGVVQDKLFLPGLLKLKRLIDNGFFGDILSVRGEFGYWVFEGDWQPSQRPSWNYRKEDGGGIIVDMLCHWRYVLSNLFGKVNALSCYGKTHIPTRYDEDGKAYQVTADDAAYSTFEIEGGIVAHINSSWNVRVNRDELFELQIDGTEGSAVAGLRNCKVQHRVNTPMAIWNPDLPDKNNYREQWIEVPMNGDEDNAFKIQWEMFLDHVVTDAPYRFDLLEGAKGVQFAELGLKSWQQRRWLDIPELTLDVKKEGSIDGVK
ncbi:putative dehydrogenase [Pullulanibacillus pueri]|uniref:Oxidoreductase n=1 Tax=Pullulanibacillus pueri TaxID=1437324 RepID=A0A8J2ZYX5_9BACL|nr:Gfo/Idh/MocA family oxidoreductase [Pullulanibacillus pueri]MBM7682988.1 putative dehydrogenase [Pullulanibacillus pueri]GGH85943.1 oxidoreductase [Pullulanibacillus pueri]